MKVVDIETGLKHEVRSYHKDLDYEVVQCDTWSGYHVIGVDCQFESDSKCDCTWSTGYMVENVCNICGKVVIKEPKYWYKSKTLQMRIGKKTWTFPLGFYELTDLETGRMVIKHESEFELIK